MLYFYSSRVHFGYSFSYDIILSRTHFIYSWKIPSSLSTSRKAVNGISSLSFFSCSYAAPPTSVYLCSQTLFWGQQDNCWGSQPEHTSLPCLPWELQHKPRGTLRGPWPEPIFAVTGWENRHSRQCEPCASHHTHCGGREDTNTTQTLELNTFYLLLQESLSISQVYGFVCFFVSTASAC